MHRERAEKSLVLLPRRFHQQVHGVCGNGYNVENFVQLLYTSKHPSKASNKRNLDDIFTISSLSPSGLVV